jgi:hypothetical protein
MTLMDHMLHKPEKTFRVGSINDGDTKDVQRWKLGSKSSSNAPQELCYTAARFRWRETKALFPGIIHPTYRSAHKTVTLLGTNDALTW